MVTQKKPQENGLLLTFYSYEMASKCSFYPNIVCKIGAISKRLAFYGGVKIVFLLLRHSNWAKTLIEKCWPQNWCHISPFLPKFFNWITEKELFHVCKVDNSVLISLQCVSFEKLLKYKAVAQKQCIFNPMLVMPKCIWEVVVYLKDCKQTARNVNLKRNTQYW